MRPEFYVLAIARDVGGAPDVGAGDALTTRAHLDHTIQIDDEDSGDPFVGSLDLEVSNDGVVWVPLQAGITGPELLFFESSFAFLRVNVTAYTSGEPVVRYGGMMQRIEI